MFYMHQACCSHMICFFCTRYVFFARDIFFAQDMAQFCGNVEEVKKGGDMLNMQHSRLVQFCHISVSNFVTRYGTCCLPKNTKVSPSFAKSSDFSNNSEMYLEKCSGMFYMHQACVTVSGVWVQDLSRAYQLVSTHHPGDPFHPCLNNFCPPLPNHFPVFQILHFMTRLMHTD